MPPRVPLAIIAALSIGLALLPPTRLLGYEFAWGTGLLFAIVFSPLLRRESRVRCALALIVPLGISLVSALFVKNCNLLEGVVWYGVLVVPQALLTIVLVRALSEVRRGLLVYYGVVAAAAGLMIAGPLLGPSMRVYSRILGFFAGSLYDEALPIPTALYWHQTMTLLFAYALWAWRFGSDRSRAWLALVVALGIDAGGRKFGFRVTYEELNTALPRTIVTEHLVLHFALGGAVERRIGEVWPEAERAALKMARKIAGDDEAIARTLRDEPTHVYIYESFETKERLLGAKHTQFARPWRPEVHVFATDAAIPSLQHELVHTFARTWSSGPFAIPSRAWLVPDMGLTEGVAVALADDGDFALFESMAALLAEDKLPDLRALLGAGFYADSGARAYTATGAFIAWLINTRGIAVVRRAYELSSIAAAVDEPIDRLIDQYTAFLRTTKVDERTRRAYADQFKERPLYARVCGREIAKKKTDAARLADAGRYDDAEASYVDIRRDDPGDSSVMLALLDLDRRRALHSPAAATHYEDVLVGAIAKSDLSEPQRVRLLEQLGDRLLQRDALDEAAKAYDDATAKATRPDDVRRLAIKRALLPRPDAAAIGLAIDGSTDAPRAVALLFEAYHRTPADPLVAYLLARRLANAGDVARAYVYGTAAAASVDVLPPAVRFELFRLLADWAVRLRITGDFVAWTRALTTRAETPLEQKIAAETLERTRFYEQHQTW